MTGRRNSSSQFSVAAPEKAVPEHQALTFGALAWLLPGKADPASR
jgi:hypothetical protein